MGRTPRRAVKRWAGNGGGRRRRGREGDGARDGWMRNVSVTRGTYAYVRGRLHTEYIERPKRQTCLASTSWYVPILCRAYPSSASCSPRLLPFSLLSLPFFFRPRGWRYRGAAEYLPSLSFTCGFSMPRGVIGNSARGFINGGGGCENATLIESGGNGVTSGGC